MNNNVTPIHGKDAGVVDFGCQITGHTAVVEGREIPRMMVKSRGDHLITIRLDRRFEIDVPRELSGAVCWMIANALAIGEGYPYLGSETKDRPFAPQVMGIYGPESNV